AWEDADTPAAVALFAEDSSYRSNIFEEPYLGRKGVEEYWSTVTATQSDVQVWMGQPVIEGDRVIVEFWTRMLGGGEPLTLVGNLLLRLDDDGLCTDLREYWQLVPELRDPWPGWGEEAPGLRTGGPGVGTHRCPPKIEEKEERYVSDLWMYGCPSRDWRQGHPIRRHR